MKPKKFFSILACVMLAVVVIAAFFPYEQIQDPVTFYYPRSEYRYGSQDGVIGSEQRDVGGRKNDLGYMLALYLEGPMDQNLIAPFPGKSLTRILTLKQAGNSLVILLSDLGDSMTDGEFSLACACLTKTCLEMTNVQAVQITSGDRAVRMTHGNLIFFDESASVIQPMGEEKK